MVPTFLQLIVEFSVFVTCWMLTNTHTHTGRHMCENSCQLIFSYFNFRTKKKKLIINSTIFGHCYYYCSWWSGFWFFTFGFSCFELLGNFFPLEMLFFLLTFFFVVLLWKIPANTITIMFIMNSWWQTGWHIHTQLNLLFSVL